MQNYRCTSSSWRCRSWRLTSTSTSTRNSYTEIPTPAGLSHPSPACKCAFPDESHLGSLEANPEAWPQVDGGNHFAGRAFVGGSQKVESHNSFG